MSSFLGENDKLFIYKYVVDEFKIVNGPSTISLGPLNVAAMVIEHNYITNVFPFFKVILNLTPATYDYILTNKDDIKFKVRILKLPMEKTTGTKKMKTEVINSVFSTYLDMDNSTFDKSEYKRRQKMKTASKEDKDDLYNMTNVLELCLFNDSYVSKLRGTVNFVMSSGNVGSCIGYTLSKLGVSNVLMSPLENSKSYSPFVMPAYSGIDALSYLDQNFGLYKAGSMIYFGLKRGYILNCKGGCTAYEPNEVKKTTLLVGKSGGGVDTAVGTIKVPNQKENEYRIALSPNAVKTTSASGITNVLSGVDAHVVNTGSTSIMTGTSGAKTKSGVAYSNNMIDDSENECVASTYAAQQKMKGTMVTITAQDINIEAFEPNKEFSFIFEDTVSNKEYKGSYKISSSIISFSGGPEWTVDIAATFSKV